MAHRAVVVRIVTSQAEVNLSPLEAGSGFCMQMPFSGLPGACNQTERPSLKSLRRRSHRCFGCREVWFWSLASRG
jgi:hypothetical protein